ncbi:MAG TPA: SirB2 family protein [Caulobacteraceae bacterium]|nr:SirB2 family protein [Caulobacteraceae bacterium]
MEEFYPQIRAVHIGAVLASGALFMIRGGALNLFGATWVKAFPVRLLSWTIDTVLLTAALMLMTVVQQYPFVHAWLTVKVVLLVVYIGLGTVALRAERPPRVRLAFWAAAMAVFAYILTVARAHDPLGFLAGLAG